MKELSKTIAVRVSPKEIKMIEELKGAPYCINLSAYIRASIHHLYKKHTNKSGRANTK